MINDMVSNVLCYVYKTLCGCDIKFEQCEKIKDEGEQSIPTYIGKFLGNVL